MSKKSRFRGHFDRQHGKRDQTLFKSARQDLYHIFWSMSRQLSWEKSLLLTFQILGVLVNTLPANGKYPVLNRDNLKIPVQMQLSQRQKNLLSVFAAYLKYILNFQRFAKKMTLIDFVFPKLRTLKTWLEKCLKSPDSDDILTSNMVNGHKYWSNLHSSTFFIFIDHCQENWVRKRVSYWHAKLLVNTLAADANYPVLNKENLTIPIQIQLSRKTKIFWECFAAFFKSRVNFEHFGKKDDPHAFCISETTDSENVVR